MIKEVRSRLGSGGGKSSDCSESSRNKGFETYRLDASSEENPSNPSPRQRPWHIGLVDLGGVSGINLGKLARKLNSLQTGLFHFEAVTPSVTNLGAYDRVHYYSDEHYFTLIRSRIQGSDCKFGIGVTHETLDSDRFNRHTEEEGVGVVTIEDAEKYTPLGKTRDQYLCYLILCEAFCIVAGEHLEHDTRRYCLFDMCIKKDDLIACLSSPHICSVCEHRLRDAGFSDTDIEQAKRILAYVGGTSLLDVVKSLITNPIIGYLGGGLAIGILSEFIAHFPTRAILGALGFFLFCFLVFTWIKYKRVQPKL